MEQNLPLRSDTMNRQVSLLYRRSRAGLVDPMPLERGRAEYRRHSGSEPALNVGCPCANRQQNDPENAPHHRPHAFSRAHHSATRGNLSPQLDQSIRISSRS
jgi:hypothetical protein